jgi:hypothetical protein
MDTTDSQEHNITDFVNHFTNQAQRFKNAYEDQNKETLDTRKFIAQEIEKLQIQM